MRPLLLVALLATFLVTWQLGRRDLYSSHEARAAQNAQRMLDTGEWGLPVLFDGQADLQKPPGFYWLVAAVGWLNGGAVDPWAARLPAAAAGLLTVLLVYGFLRREGRPVAAVVAAVALATAVHFTAISRTARIDVPLTCAVTAAVLAFYRGCRRSGTEYSVLSTQYLLAAVAAAFAVMLKGPVGLALIGSTAVVLLAIERRSQATPLGSPLHLPVTSAVLGTLVVLGLALPWFLWANHATGGEFYRVFVLHHNVARFTGSSPLMKSYPPWEYVHVFATHFLPWTPAFVLLTVWAVRSGRWRADPHLRLGLVWVAVMFAVLSAAKFKRADYLLPLFPGAAIALGCAAEHWLATRTDPRTVRRVTAGFAVVVAGVLVGWQVMIYRVEPGQQAKEEKRAFAAVVRTHAPAPQTVLLFRVESHLLAYHLGRPVHTLVEWGELRDRLAEPGPHVVVMPPEFVYPAGLIVTGRKIEVVARLDEFTPALPARPLVLLRTAE